MLPVWDNHMHLDRTGRYLDAVREFKKAGGTGFLLVHKGVRGLPLKKGEDYRAHFDVTVEIARAVRELDVTVLTALGPHPADITYFIERAGLGIGDAVEAMRKGLETAAAMVADGLANAIGEVGRPHYPVSAEVLEASNRTMEYAMVLAGERSCPVVLHTESATVETFAELAAMADRAGLPRERVVKHFSPPLVAPGENHGLFPSIIAGRDAVEKAARSSTRFFMETDYIDDPARPGAVLGPATVPKRTLALMRSGVLDEEAVHRIHGENVDRMYR